MSEVIIYIGTSTLINLITLVLYKMWLCFNSAGCWAAVCSSLRVALQQVFFCLYWTGGITMETFTTSCKLERVRNCHEPQLTLMRSFLQFLGWRKSSIICLFRIRQLLVRWIKPKKVQTVLSSICYFVESLLIALTVLDSSTSCAKHINLLRRAKSRLSDHQQTAMDQFYFIFIINRLLACLLHLIGW